MKKYILDLTVRETVAVGKQAVLLRLTADEQLPEMLPGQFVEVRVDQTPTVMLRRPISIHYYDKALKELGLLVQLVGDGTRWMATLKSGDTVNIVLPLGNGFTLPADKAVRPLLVGGGVGVAPLLYLGMKLKEMGIEPTFLLGSRRRDDRREEQGQGQGKQPQERREFFHTQGTPFFFGRAYAMALGSMCEWAHLTKRPIYAILYSTSSLSNSLYSTGWL